MRILLVGSGGREHALAWKLSQSPAVGEIFAAPGNGGTAGLATNLPVRDDDIPAIVDLAREKRVDLVVPGPELPLVLGISDALGKVGIPCFGPSQFASQLEGSKIFAKKMMQAAGVPTARFGEFDDFASAKKYALDLGGPMVVKADGLAAGKGVIVCDDPEQAVEALAGIMRERRFGDAGTRVVIEERLVGEEASFMAFCDGENVALLPSSQDHKPVHEGDTGPNTGGMGAYSPAPVLPGSEYEAMSAKVILPVVRKLAEEGHPFRGVIYAGLMMTADGPKVLEYNVRFGDPECQPLMMRLDADLAEIMLSCAEGRLKPGNIRWKPGTATCVVMAARGYPDSYPKGMEIRGLELAEEVPGVKVFQAGTVLEDGVVRSSGGRVLGVTALGADLAESRERAYAAADRVRFENSFYRRDIGEKGLGR